MEIKQIDDAQQHTIATALDLIISDKDSSNKQSAQN
jgi:hypothetical protein